MSAGKPKSFYETILGLVHNKHDLTLRQVLVLLECYRSGEKQTVRGLAEVCKVAKPVVTRAVDRLETYEYAERQADPADRRSVLITLTRKGRDFARAISV